MNRVILVNKKARLLIFLSVALLLIAGSYAGYLWYQSRQTSKTTNDAVEPVADKKLFNQFAAIDDSEMSKVYYDLINLNKKDEALEAVKRVISSEDDQSKREALLSIFEGAAAAIDRQDDAKAIGVWMAEKYPSFILFLHVADLYAKTNDYTGALKYAEQAAALAASSGNEEQREEAQIKVDIYKMAATSTAGNQSSNSRGQRVPNE
jgi:tetratricopeptide (TPR) repeat protein